MVDSHTILYAYHVAYRHTLNFAINIYLTNAVSLRFIIIAVYVYELGSKYTHKKLMNFFYITRLTTFRFLDVKVPNC